MDNKRKKVLVIGLDGATFDVLQPLMDEGIMPNLEQLKESGASGKLNSTIPPVTGPSWVSFATGKNPGQTGVLDFMVKQRDSYVLHPVNSSFFRGQAVWDYISAAGNKVCLLNYPMLIPPYELNGCIVTGLGTDEDQIATYPPELKKTLDAKTGNYEVVTNFLDEKYINNEDLYLSDLNRVFDKKLKAAQYLLNNDTWDLFLFVISETDWMQHYMWKHIDSTHPLHDSEKAVRYKPQFNNFFRKVDDFIGEIQTSVGDNANIFVVSDHGFGPHLKCFNVTQWLYEQGYLKRKKGRLQSSLKKKVFSYAKSLAGKKVARLIPGRLLWKSKEPLAFLKTDLLDEIDLKESTAVALLHTNPLGAIYILDSQSKRASGDYEGIREKIISDLKRLEKTEKNLTVIVYKPEEVYRGDAVANFPDIIFSINNWSCLIKKSFEGPVIEENCFTTSLTGSHRMDGILIANGPDIKRGFEVEGANIIDIAPTLLHIFGLKPPEDLDGAVLQDMLESDDAELRPVKKVDGDEPKLSLDKEDREKIKENLKNLGYL